MRVALYGIGVVSLALGVISVLLAVLLTGSVPETQDQELALRATAAEASIARAAAPEFETPSTVAPLAPVDGATSNEIIVVVLDATGRVLTSSGVVGGEPPTVSAALLDRARRDGRAAATVAAWGVSLRVHVRPWERADLGRSGFVVTAQALRRQETERAGLFVVIVIADLVGLVAASVGIWFAAGRALRPLRELTRMADEIGRATDLSRRLPEVRRRDDVGRLTASFNGMMARLQEAYGRLSGALAAQQRFTADASHELRTPLTTIRNNAGFLRANPDAAAPDREAALVDIEAEGARMGRLVDDLLTLARAAVLPAIGGRPERSMLDLGALAHEVCRQARGLHPDREFHCAGAPVTMSGDAEALRRLMWILVDNAVAHTTEGGTIWVAVTRSGTGTTVQVSDDGTGIPPGLEARVFDRFFRADPARRTAGSGLGLSIARLIVREHGGEITARNNERGGATFVAELP